MMNYRTMKKARPLQNGEQSGMAASCMLFRSTWMEAPSRQIICAGGVIFGWS
jgi:hypothetical protein